MTDAVEPFRLAVPEAELDDLRARLRATRWPERETVGDWSQGVPLAELQEICRVWAEEYDWRVVETELNGLGQARTVIDGLGIHFLHVRSPEPGALPLVLTHGWPGSVVELLDVVRPLADPRAHGGDPAEAFHVVVPSLPGYGFSDRPTAPGWGVERIADAWAQLMGRLGYDRFGAGGTDWGTTVSTLLGQRHRERVVGLHLVPPLAPPDPATFDDLTASERGALAALEHAAEWESGYSREHATRPQTIGYALTDSPAALAAWVLEKLWAWTDGDGLAPTVPRRRLLDNLMLYWLPRTGASSARLYWESIRQVNAWIAGDGPPEPVDVPVACTVFPAELQRPSRRWAARRFPDIRSWSEPERGGHFPALEVPDVLVAEVRAAFRALRP